MPYNVITAADRHAFWYKSHGAKLEALAICYIHAVLVWQVLTSNEPSDTTT